MAPAIAYALPAMQLMCNIVLPGSPDSNIGITAPIIGYQSPLTPTPTNQSATATVPNGYVLHPDIGVAYKVIEEEAGWKVAKERCSSEGAHLANIDSFIKFEHAMNQAPSVAWMWVGILRMYDDQEWVSVSTGSALSSLPWASREPNGNEDCVYASRDPRGLRNFKCNDPTPPAFVCEVPIPKNNGGSQDQESGN